MANQTDILKDDHRWRHVELTDFGRAYENISPVEVRVETNAPESVRLSSIKNPITRIFPTSAYALNLKSATKQWLLKIADDAAITTPIHVRTRVRQPGSMIARTMIDVGDRARVALIDLVNTAYATFINRSTEITIGAGSTVTYFLHNHASVDHFETINVFCGQGSVLRLVTATTGTAIGHIELNVHLQGLEASASIGAMCLPQGSGQAVVHTLQHHLGQSTTSDLEARSVLVDRSKSLYNGFICIDKTAGASNAYQKNNNVLLSGLAKAFSVPNLEIHANDVRCTHGSTTTGLSRDELFYASSRGINDRDARRIIATAFFDPIITRLENKETETLARSIAKKSIRDGIK